MLYLKQDINFCAFKHQVHVNVKIHGKNLVNKHFEKPGKYIVEQQIS